MICWQVRAVLFFFFFFHCAMRSKCLWYGCPQESILEGPQKWYYGENPGYAAVYIKTVFASIGSLTIIPRYQYILRLRLRMAEMKNIQWF